MVAPLPPNPSQSLDLELGEETAQGTYANLVLVSHSPHEFVIDFARMLPGLPKAKVGARVIVTPSHMVSLVETLRDNLDKYERAWGAVSRRG